VEGIAFINVRGVIARRGGSVSFFGMTFSWEGQDTIRAAIAMAMQDPDVKAVLLSFDSPGGTAAGVKELADFIAAQTAKPVYAYADGLCASAAYWLATATGRVYAPLTAEVGSIGVIAAHVDRSAANAARGIRVTYITGGAYKAAGNPDSPLSASDQSYLQEIVSKLHAVFRDDVAAHMPVDAADPKAWGDGQIFLADTALELGLLTGIVTDMDELLVLIKKEIHMDKEELAKKHPELLARIQAEARAEAETAMKAEHEKALAATAVSTAALVKAVVGDEAAAKVSALAEAGFTAAQIEVLGGLIAPAFGLIVPAPQAAPEANTESEGRKEMLELLRKASPAPVNTSVAPRGGDAVQAAIDQISAVRA
jgi:signal peptide peptidase SppA